MGRRSRARAAVAAAEAETSRLVQLLDEAVTARYSGAALTPWELPTVVACRRVIADTVAQLPLRAMRNGTPRPDQPALMLRPNPAEPYWLTMHRLVDSLTRHGRSYLIPTAWGADGYPIAARAVDGNTIVADFDAFGTFLGGTETTTGQWLPAGRDGIVWIPYEVPVAGHPGQAPMQSCWRAVEYLAALYDMAGSFWEAGFPSIAVMIEGRLGPGQANEVKSQVLSSWARRHEPAVIDNGGKLQQLGASAVESELIDSIAVANAEICRAHGVMPSLVNVAAGDSLTYSTTSGEFSKWKLIGLGPYLYRIGGAFQDLTPWGTTAEFNTTELTKSDDAATAAYLTAALAGEAWLTVDEARQGFVNLGPMPAGAVTAPPVGSPVTT